MVAHNKGKKYPPDPLTPAEAQRLLNACGGTLAGRRMAAMTVLLYRGGLRVSEMCSVQCHDWESAGVTGAGRVRVMSPKGLGNGAMIREVGLDPKTNDYIKNWMAFRPHPEMGPMFITKDGTPPKANHVRRWLPRLAKIAGIRRRVHPHGLRHTFARQLYDEGVGMVDIMHALGHTRLDTTQRYLQSVGCGRSVSINQGREW